MSNKASWAGAGMGVLLLLALPLSPGSLGAGWLWSAAVAAAIYYSSFCCRGMLCFSRPGDIRCRCRYLDARTGGGLGCSKNTSQQSHGSVHLCRSSGRESGGGNGGGGRFSSCCAPLTSSLSQEQPACVFIVGPRHLSLSLSLSEQHVRAVGQLCLLLNFCRPEKRGGAGGSFRDSQKKEIHSQSVNHANRNLGW